MKYGLTCMERDTYLTDKPDLFRDRNKSIEVNFWSYK